MDLRFTFHEILGAKYMIFDSFKIKNISLPSRIVRSATAERIAMRREHDGECLGNIYATLAGGGVGLIISGHVAAHPSGRLHPSMPFIHENVNAAVVIGQGFERLDEFLSVRDIDAACEAGIAGLCHVFLERFECVCFQVNGHHFAALLE